MRDSVAVCDAAAPRCEFGNERKDNEHIESFSKTMPAYRMIFP